MSRHPFMSRKFDEDFFVRVSTLAKKSTMTHKHGAIIVRNNEIISEGVNHMAPFLMHKHSVHAEIDALCKIRGKNKKFMEECTMLVVRIGPPSKDFAFKMSKPCKNCSDAILKSGIRRVFYSAENGDIN